MEARNEVDIDRLVDYRREYESRLKKAKMSGDGHMVALCPFHADTKQSFSVDLKTGRWYCFTEGRGGNYICFPALCDAGIYLREGQEAEFGPLSVRNYRRPANLLYRGWPFPGEETAW